MAVFFPTVNTNVPPAVAATTGDTVTYSQVKQSLGSFVYISDKFYLQSGNQSQISGIVQYSHTDANGNQRITNLISTIDPYQRQSAVYLSTEGKNIVIDGQNKFLFNLLPNSDLQIKVFANKMSNQDALNYLAPNNFQTLQDAMGNYTFFRDYQDKIK